VKTVLLATALALITWSAHAQMTVVSPFHNGMGFSYNADGSHDTYVFRNGALFDQHFGAPEPMQQMQPLQSTQPLLPDNN
jgi:hypothetical protein